MSRIPLESRPYREHIGLIKRRVARLVRDERRPDADRARLAIRSAKLAAEIRACFARYDSLRDAERSAGRKVAS